MCNTSVNFIIKYDKKDLFRFVPIQSNLGQNILTYIGIQPSTIDSVILYEPKMAYYYKSSAALEIMKNLGGFFYFIIILKIIPKSILNMIYDFIAQNRYKWFGKKESCMIPSAELKSKFLE